MRGHDPTAVENLEPPWGRGLMLMRHDLTDVAFNDRGSSVTMSKALRNGGKEEPAVTFQGSAGQGSGSGEESEAPAA
jgi:hypothetical protein